MENYDKNSIFLLKNAYTELIDDEVKKANEKSKKINMNITDVSDFLNKIINLQNCLFQSLDNNKVFNFLDKLSKLVKKSDDETINILSNYLKYSKFYEVNTYNEYFSDYDSNFNIVYKSSDDIKFFIEVRIKNII